MGFKKLIAGLLTAALCVGVFGTASAELKWVTERLAIRTLKAATADGGASDSLVTSLGAAAATDTSVAFKYPVRTVPGLSDSNQFIIAHLSFGAALASGESIYVQVEGSGDNGVTWRALNTGSIPIGAPLSGQVQQGHIVILPKPNSTTNTTAFSPVLTPLSQMYGAWFGFPKLRLKILSDRSGAVAGLNTYQVWVSYVTDK